MLIDSSIFDFAICEKAHNAITNKIRNDEVYHKFRSLEDREENLDLIFWTFLMLADAFDFTE